MSLTSSEEAADEIARLKSLLAAKDEEIARLKLELAGPSSPESTPHVSV